MEEPPLKKLRTAQKQLLILVEGAGSLGASWSTIRTQYIEKIVRNVASTEAPNQKEALPPVEMALVVVSDHSNFTGPNIQKTGWITDPELFLEWLTEIPFEGGGCSGVPLAQALAEALTMFSSPGLPEPPRGPPGATTSPQLQRHVLMIAASPPCPIPKAILRPPMPGPLNGDSKDTSWILADAAAVASLFPEHGVSLSLIAPVLHQELKALTSKAKPANAPEPPEAPRCKPTHCVIISDSFLAARIALQSLQQPSMSVSSSGGPTNRAPSGAIPTLSGAAMRAGPGAHTSQRGGSGASSGLPAGPGRGLAVGGGPGQARGAAATAAASGSGRGSVVTAPAGVSTGTIGQPGVATAGKLPGQQQQAVAAHMAASRGTGVPGLPGAPPIQPGSQAGALSAVGNVRVSGLSQDSGVTSATLAPSTGATAGKLSGGMLTQQQPMLTQQQPQQGLVSMPKAGGPGAAGLQGKGLSAGGQMMTSGVTAGGLPGLPAGTVSVPMGRGAGRGVPAGASAQQGKALAGPSSTAAAAAAAAAVAVAGGRGMGVGIPGGVPGRQPMKPEKIWEGNLILVKKGGDLQHVTRMEMYRTSGTDRPNPAAEWPGQLQIQRVISVEYMQRPEYRSKAELVICRCIGNFTTPFFANLNEKKLCGVVQTPIHTLLMGSEKQGRIICLILPQEICLYQPTGTTAAPPDPSTADSNAVVASNPYV